MNVTVTVNATGPVIQGRAPGVIKAMARDVEDVLGRQGYAEVMTNLNASIKHPTPYYETQVTVQRQPIGVVVHDRGIVYGPWLEGTSARNKTTRFKGYKSFARGTQKLMARAGALAQQVVDRHLGRLQ